MKKKSVADLCGRHGPEEVDAMLHDVETTSEPYELLDRGRTVAFVIPCTEPAGQRCPVQARLAVHGTEMWLDCTFTRGHGEFPAGAPPAWLHSWQTPGQPGPFVLAPAEQDVRNIEGGPKGYPYE